MFSSNTAILRMWYEGEGYPLMVYVEDEGIVVQVAIKTLNLQSVSAQTVFPFNRL
jgi:hypothetical protein